jgi:hypothetical protein
MYYLYRNLNVGKFTKKVNAIYVVTIIFAAILFPFILMDGFGTIDFGSKWSVLISMLTTANSTLFLTMAWVKKWIKKID